MEPPPKRRRLSNDDGADDAGGSLPRSLSAPISPPARRRPSVDPTQAERLEELLVTASSSKPSEKDIQTFKSPFQLTWIRDLADAANADAVTLRDLLGDPLIAECWDFNYLHDIDFLVEAFDGDVRQSVEIHVVHGFWKQEDGSRLVLQVSLLGLILSPGLLTYIPRRDRSKPAPTRMSFFIAPSCPRCLVHITRRCLFFSGMMTQFKS